MSVWLDCSNPQTAAASLGLAFGIDGSSVVSAARELDADRIAEGSDVRIALPRAVLASRGSSLTEVVEACQGAYYFHGTRLRDPSDVLEDGLLPLSLAFPRLMNELSELACMNCPTAGDPREAVAEGRGGDFGWQARLKLNDRIHHGPWAELVRQNVASIGRTGFHDYVEWPEIVEDVIGAFMHETGCDLGPMYKACTLSYVVKFKVPKISASAIEAAIWYIYGYANGVDVTGNTRCAFDGKGQRVRGEVVEAIDPIEIPR